MTLKTDSCAKALAHLRSIVAHHARLGTARLPTLRRLADGAGVSHVTMLRAVGELKKTGRLVARPGSGMYLAGMKPAKTRPVPTRKPRPTPRWEHAAQQFESDILAGVFQTAPHLPLTKELCARYGVCGHTFGRCLERAMARRMIMRDRRGFRVRPPTVPAGRGNIILISAGEGDFIMPGWDQRHMTHMHGIETTCSQAGLGVRKVFYGYGYPASGEIRLTAGKGPPYRRRDLEDILGFVLIARGLQDLGHRDFVLGLAATGRPVSVLDENGGVITALDGSAPSNVRVFSLGNSMRPGQNVGRHLLELGHRRVAYICGPPSVRWSRNRGEGLHEVFDAAGLRDAIVPVDIGEEGARLMTEAVVTRESQPNSPALDQFHGALGEALASRLRGLLARHDITAWVGANDDIGIACCRFLKGAGVDVPGRVSVMGFDDSYPALVNDLTSYNFNSPSVVRAMINHILRPTWAPLRGRADNIVEIDGFVNTRRTTGVPSPAFTAAHRTGDHIQ